MYLIKSIYFDSHTDCVKVENCIRILKSKDSKKTLVSHDYWGKTNLHIGQFANISQFTKPDNKYLLLSYVSEYSVKDLRDGFKELSFHVSTYQPDKIEGYIIFIKSSIDTIKTNGKKLFGRYLSEIVAVLKDGEYLEFSGKKIKVVDNHLILFI